MEVYLLKEKRTAGRLGSAFIPFSTCEPMLEP